MIQDIINDLLKPSLDVSSVLKKCMVFAKKIEHEKLYNWIKLELNGYDYDNRLEIPNYRKIHVQSFGEFQKSFGQREILPIPPSLISEQYREIVETYYVIEPLAVLEDILISRSSRENQQKRVSNWPADLIVLEANNIWQDACCLSAWREIPVGAIKGVIDCARNRTLEFMLEFEESGFYDEQFLAPLQEEAKTEVTQMVNNIILKSGAANIAIGNGVIQQNIDNRVNQGSLDDLVKVLTNLGVDEEDLSEIKDILNTHKETNESVPSKKISSWIGKIFQKAGEGAFAVGGKVAMNVICSALLDFLGLGS